MSKHSRVSLRLPPAWTSGLGFSALVIGLGIGSARAVDISGVLPVAADQPQTMALLENATTGAVIYGSGAYAGTYAIQAYLDTGTSSILLSQETASALGVGLATSGGQNVTINDVALGGTDTYFVSNPYNVLTAPYSVNVDTTVGNPPPPVGSFGMPVNSAAMEVSQQPANALTGPIDIMGMPLMEGNVTVFYLAPANNVTNLNNLQETQTWIYKPGTFYNPSALTTNPGIVPTQYQVQMSFASFSQYTTVTPSTAAGPMQDANPFIGPNPITGADPNIPPVTLSYTQATPGGSQTNVATGSFLFDTGAQASFISQAEAAKLGVSVLTDASGNPYLVDAATGQMLANQFVLPLTGAGGASIEAAGFYLDSLTLQTVQGMKITFDGAPVLVENLTLVNPNTGQALTLDGDLGMNFFEPSMTADLSQLNATPFTWMTFDQPNGLLGLSLVPEPSTLVLLAAAMAALALSKRRYGMRA